MSQSQTLFTLTEAAAALNIPMQWPESAITGVSIDTRTLQKGDLFIALSGTPSGGFSSSFASTGDGHTYLQMAQEKGAAAAIVSTPNPALTIPQLVVKDTLLEGLWALARASRRRMRGKVIGITGSAGKTTTKQMLAAMLGAPASPGSYNNFWGVPLTLCRIPRTAPFAVIEMGMNRPGEIAKLSQLTNPHVAMVVNVRPVHLEHLGSLEAIAREKLSIAEGLTKDGTLVVPIDLDLRHSPWQGKINLFGDGADVCALSHKTEGDDYLVTFKVGSEKLQGRLRNGAPHRVYNATAALAAAVAAGYPAAQALAQLPNEGAMASRGTAQTINGITLIDDAFNANPASMAAGLQSLKEKPVQGRKLAVLGDMLELGTEAETYHKALLPLTEDLHGVYAIGPHMQALYDLLPEDKRLGWSASPTDFDIQAFASSLQPGDTILLKGSKKMLYVPGIPAKLAEALKNK